MKRRPAPPPQVVYKKSRSAAPASAGLRPPEDHHWSEEHEAWKAQQHQAQTKPSPVVGEIEAYVEEIKRLHNDHDALRSLAIKAVNLKHAEKSAHHMEQFPNGVFVHSKAGEAQHLGLRLGLAMPAVPMELPDKRLPKTPTGLRPFIKSMRKGEE